MKFDVRFFVVAVVLSTVAAIFENLYQWLSFFHVSPPLILILLEYYGLAAVAVACGIALPFVVMYILGKKVESPSAFKPITISIFLGSWVGQVSVFVVDIYVYVLDHGSYPYWTTPLGLAWQLFVRALSGVFFVSLAAVLLAYYRKAAKETRANTQLQAGLSIQD